MADIVTPDIRSRMMSGIRSKNTKPELQVRRFLHAQGFRFLLHDKRLPGKPDLVFPKWKSVVFVHGCFWHMHNCRYFKLPGTKAEFWREKLNANRERDERTRQQLESIGWRVLIIYECELRDTPETSLNKLAMTLREGARRS